MADTLENRKLAEQKARQIELDILTGYFDPSLAKYKPQTHSLANASDSAQKPLTLAERWEQYTQFKSTQVEQTTIIRDDGKIQKRIQKLPVQDVTEAVAIRDYLLKTYSAEVTKRTLKQLNACCNWAVRSKRVNSFHWGCTMQITIELPPDLEQDLIRQAKQSNVPLHTLVLQALRQLIQSKSGSTSQWSEVILSYEGIPDSPRFESYRGDILPPREPELF